MKRFLLTSLLAFSSLTALAYPADVTAAFSDLKTTEPSVIKAINTANKTVFLAIYSLTDMNIVNALVASKHRGVRVGVKYDAVQSAQKNMQECLKVLSDNDIPADKIKVSGRGVMHNKFCVIDEKMVVTGSYNYTNNATLHNWENTVVILSDLVAHEFLMEWQRIKTKP